MQVALYESLSAVTFSFISSLKNNFMVNEHEGSVPRKMRS